VAQWWPVKDLRRSTEARSHLAAASLASRDSSLLSAPTSREGFGFSPKIIAAVVSDPNRLQCCAHGNLRFVCVLRLVNHASKGESDNARTVLYGRRHEFVLLRLKSPKQSFHF
jgi:hypothetical protein